MAAGRHSIKHVLGGGFAALALALGLVACGPTQDAGPTPDTGEQIRPAVSPGAGELPDLTDQASVTIVDGALEPNLFAGQIGDAFQLVITGDGAAHTLSIEDLVDSMAVAAEGETAIGFTIVGEPGRSQITLDGKPAGEFERRSASGAAAD